MDIIRLAQKLDTEMILGEISGTLKDSVYQGLSVDLEKSTIDLYVIKIKPIKSINITIKIGE